MKLLVPNARGVLHCLLGTALLLAAATPMWATLGDNAASVLNDQERWNGKLSSVDKGTYVLHEITMPTGTVREFVSPAGVVFGVAWEGQFPPDFRQLLGPYYQQVQQAIANQKAARQASAEQSGAPAIRPRRAPVSVETTGLVFSQGGHQRSFHGQAYIPQLLPQNVKASDIR